MSGTRWKLHIFSLAFRLPHVFGHCLQYTFLSGMAARVFIFVHAHLTRRSWEYSDYKCVVNRKGMIYRVIDES